MKLKKFRIQNYKSIKDSGYCWLASDLTILAGKNESGKTAILESVRDFDINVESIPDESLPLDESGEPIIELCFDVDNGIIEKIFKEIGIPQSKEFINMVKKGGLSVLKSKDGTYQLQDGLSSLLNQGIEKIHQQVVVKIEELVKKLKAIEQLKVVEDPQLTSGSEIVKQATAQFIGKINPLIASITDETLKQQATDTINELNQEIAKLSEENPAEKFLKSILPENMPNFIFFNDFDDILPFELPLAEAKAHKTIQDFAKVAGLDLEKVIQTTDSQRRRNLLSKHSATISGDFMGYWGQNKLDLVAEPDGDKLRLGVKEFDKTILFKPEQRSKGFQWFLSFYLRLSAEKDNINIILIDEPGLYLHAKAQEDVLKVLEKVAQKTQVIFSTHSPYLIDSERLDRIRLVTKKNDGKSIIENKIHAVADKETLTPILTAIGLELNSGIAHLDKIKNIVVEGPSDLYYLKAFKNINNKQKDCNFVFGGGSGNMPFVGTILHGWGCNVIYLYDNDKGKDDGEKNLINNWLVSKDLILTVLNHNGRIEDILDKTDFRKLVLGDKKLGYKESNSEYVKSKKLDKVVLAKNFLDLSIKNNLKLNQGSLDNISKLLENIGEKFK